MEPSQSTSASMQSDEDIKKAVRDRYAKSVSQSSEPRGLSPSASNGSLRLDSAVMIGYASEQLADLPPDAVENSLGCGNPLSFGRVKTGDVVLDIGSGAGIDVLIAAKTVGPTGKVIGLDMTPEMIARARENAVQAGATNVEFRLGDAEQMPIDDSSIDWIISNCVINLAPDKRKVFAEISRVLKPGGRVSISDMVTGHLADEIRETRPLWGRCIGGAIEETHYLELMREAGLQDVVVVSRQHFDEATVRGTVANNMDDPADRELLLRYLDKYPDTVDNIWSSRITARKPA